MKVVIAITVIALGLTGCVKSTRFDPAEASAAKATLSLMEPKPGDVLGRNREFRLGSTDKLSVEVFGVPELARAVRIDSSGDISLPLIGVIQATGETPIGLADKIASAYNVRYLRNAQVTVTLIEMTSQQVLVDGAIRDPGQYPLSGNSSLMSTIAVAKGVTDLARLDQVLIFRTINGERAVARYNLGEIREGRAPDPAIYGDDVVVVGSGPGRLGLRDLLLLTPVLGAFYQLTR